MKTFLLQSKSQRRLGDKEEFLYSIEETESSIDNMVNSLRNFLLEKEKSLSESIKNKDLTSLKNEYEIIRRFLGINPAEIQEEAISFISKILSKL